MSTSSFTVECWGCRKSETHSPVVGPEADAALADMMARGWRRKAFWPDNWDKGPWFCSEDCASNSYNAKQAEEYWKNKDEEERQREFEKYCKETKIMGPFIYFAVVTALIIASILFSGCPDVRL